MFEQTTNHQNLQNTIQNPQEQFVLPKKSFYTRSKEKFVSRFQAEQKKVNKDNVIYYFAGFTLFIVFVLFVTPIIWGWITYKPPEKTQATSSFQKSTRQTVSAPRQIKQIDLANIAKEELKNTTRDETIKAFQETLNTNDTNKLVGYVIPTPKVYITQSGCCESVNQNYVKSLFISLNQENKPWNFDQNNPILQQVRNRDGEFNDNYYATNTNGAVVGIKLNEKNHISVVNAIYNYQAFIDSFQPDTESISD
jgi:hypothetical protein